MANRRMFSLKIVDTDAFLEMPMSSQLLYFHLSMRADDEGFVGSPKRIMRLIGGSGDDLKILNSKRFILAFESGIVVIKHWLIHNVIRMDRLQKTLYQKEKETLILNEFDAYTENLQPNDNQMTTKCQPKLSKVKLSKDNITKREINIDFLIFWNLYDKKASKQKCEKKWNKLKNQEREDIISYLPKYKQSTPDKKFRKNPETFLNNRSWEDEILLPDNQISQNATNHYKAIERIQEQQSKLTPEQIADNRKKLAEVRAKLNIKKI